MTRLRAELSAPSQCIPLLFIPVSWSPEVRRASKVVQPVHLVCCDVGSVPSSGALLFQFPLPRTRGRGVPEDLVRQPCDERCQLKLESGAPRALSDYYGRVTHPTDLSSVAVDFF